MISKILVTSIFSPFLTMFSKASYSGSSKSGLHDERLNKAESIVGKREKTCYQQFFLFPQCFARLLSLVYEVEPHSSVRSIQDFSAEGCWFDPYVKQYSFKELTIVIATGFNSSLTAVHYFSNGYVGKQLVAWKE